MVKKKNNSKEIVYIDWPTGDPDLYSVPIGGGAQVRLYGQSGGFEKGDYDPAYASNGQYLAYTSYTAPAAVQPTASRPALQKELPAPATDRLDQNYPNPFASGTRIGFQLAQPTHVTLEVYNAAGQMIHTLTNATLAAGHHSVYWDGRGKGGRAVESGLYFCRLQTGTFSRTITMTLVR